MVSTSTLTFAVACGFSFVVVMLLLTAYTLLLMASAARYDSKPALLRNHNQTQLCVCVCHDKRHQQSDMFPSLQDDRNTAHYLQLLFCQQKQMERPITAQYRYFINAGGFYPNVTALRVTFRFLLSQNLLLSVTFMHPTQGVKTFSNISPYCTLAIL